METTKATGTPGPLHFEARPDEHRPGSVAYSLCCEGGEVVAEVYGTDYGDAASPESAQANAALLIQGWNTAPALLAACERALVILQYTPDMDLDWLTEAIASARS